MTDVVTRFKQPTPAKKAPSRIPYVSKKRRKQLREWRKVRIEVLGRSEHRCEARIPEVCTVRATECHHVILRSHGGVDEPWNLMALCGPDDGRAGCHAWAHQHPAEAQRLGLIRVAS
jgi:5-methylcytosine-specific restriction endonuclease McrA